MAVAGDPHLWHYPSNIVYWLWWRLGAGHAFSNTNSDYNAHANADTNSYAESHAAIHDASGNLHDDGDRNQPERFSECTCDSGSPAIGFYTV